MSLASAFRGREVLVTGGLGFIGSNLAIRLAQYGAHVTVIDSLVPQCGGNLANVDPVRDQLTWLNQDLRASALTEQAVVGKEIIFHLAGQVSHAGSMRHPLTDQSINLTATVNLLEACRAANRAARLIYTSTRQVYGRPKTLPVSEEHPVEPIDVNGINKLAAESYHLLYDRAYGIRSTVLRLTNTFGPRQRINSGECGFAGYFIYQAMRGETLKVFGRGLQRRDFNYVDDVVDALLLASITDACQGQVFNLGNRPAYSVVDFIQRLSEFCRFEVQKVPFPENCHAIEIGDYYGDYSRFSKLTGWEPRTDLPSGLSRAIEFYRRHGEAYGL